MSRLLLAAAPAAAVLLAIPTAAHAGESVQVKMLDLNDTGASGNATLTATDAGDLKIVLDATGMTPNSPHAQHIHGSTNGMDFMCPDKSDDADGNGFVSTEEGLPKYGDIHISLTTTGDTTKASGLAVDRMPTADAVGNLSYTRTIPAADLPAGTIAHLKDLHVVQHGIDVNDNGRYDMEGLGESTFATSLGVDGIPEEATDPATCGMVTGAAAGSMPAGGVDTGDGSTAPTSAPWLYGFAALALAGAGATLVGRRRLGTVRPPSPMDTRSPTRGPRSGAPRAPGAVACPHLARAGGRPPRARRAHRSRRRPLWPIPPDAGRDRADDRAADADLAADPRLHPVARGHLDRDRPRPAAGRDDGGARRRGHGRLVHEAPTPGSLGPAVLAGHVNWKSRDGAFARLHTLRAGDPVNVARRDGTVAMFEVTRSSGTPRTASPPRPSTAPSTTPGYGSSPAAASSTAAGAATGTTSWCTPP